MKQTLQLQIPAPCHENWNAMNATQQGRFCLSCQKEVVDFSTMTDKEILAHLSTASSGICGRVQQDQLNRFIELPEQRKQYSFKYFWSVLIASSLISNKSAGQVQAPKDTMVSLPVGPQESNKPVFFAGAISTFRDTNDPEWQFNGRVVDENNIPVSYASVMIKGTKQGVATDSAGLFSLKTKRKPDDVELLITSVGFMQQTVKLNDAAAIKSLVVEEGVIKVLVTLVPMKMAVAGEVVVVASNCRRTGKISGAMWVIRKETWVEAITQKFFGKEVTVYPNPIAANSVFNIRFNVKEMGQYAIQFTDASGKIITGRQLNIVSKNQLQSFNSNMFSGHGVYFVSITRKQTMQKYMAKLMVQ